MKWLGFAPKRYNIDLSKLKNLSGASFYCLFINVPIYGIGTLPDFNKEKERAKYSFLSVVENYWEDYRYYYSPSCVDRKVDCLPFR